MLCATCWRNLRGQDSRIWKGTYDLYFRPHQELAHLQSSAETGCHICRPIFDLYEDTRRSRGYGELEAPISINASLSVVQQENGPELYRLDYTLKQAQLRIKQTFVLQQTSLEDPPHYPTPLAGSTGSDECFNLAVEWINHCNDHHDCIPKRNTDQNIDVYYPTRLIDLGPLKSKDVELTDSIGNLDTVPRIKPAAGNPIHPDTVKLKLVDKIEVQKGANTKYVTLSHCWGNPQQDGYATPPRLTTETLDTYTKEGIRVGDLTLTFRQAVEFAARIPSVRYLWIDSLCIIQPLGESDKVAAKEWIKESREMFQVYSQSYLNISATASSNSGGGLFKTRQTSHLWADEISLNIDGLPGARAAQEVLLPSQSGVQASQSSNAHGSPTRRRNLRRCVLIDVSQWERLVNAAPVNTRGWVLQERLMAPRVLHFCDGQIAWECKERDLFEFQAPEVPNFQLKHGEIVTDERIKALEPEDGKLLRRRRFEGPSDPDAGMEHIYSFEIWARIVEMYSRTAITNPEDKLIALSGIAGMMAERMADTKDGGSPPVYVAGLWGRYLASQLLWRVEPVFNAHDRSFKNLGRRPPRYRAPSFSWAAVDAHEGNGIIYGEVTDKDLLIRLDERSIHVRLFDQESPFGMVKKGTYVAVRGKPQRIKIVKKRDAAGRSNGRFGWWPRELERHGGDPRDLEQKEHTNVYLDCPGSDEEDPGIFDKDNTYYLPAAMGPRTAKFESKYFFCLLLQEAEEQADGPLGRGAKTFRRVGLSKLSPWGDKDTYQQIIKSFKIKTGETVEKCDQWDLDSESQVFYLV